jgi:hypothetical protein
VQAQPALQAVKVPPPRVLLALQVVLLWQVLRLNQVLLRVVVRLPGHHLPQEEPLLVPVVVLPQ